MPCFVLEGAASGPSLLVSAGIHGAEYASIAAAQRLTRLDPQALHGRLTVVPIVNRSAYAARSIYVTPEDGKNLNRVFPGRPDGSHSEVLAHWLTGLMGDADAYLDLHGGDLIEALTPFAIHAPGDDDVARRAARLADAFALPYRIEEAGAGMTFSAAHALGVPAVLAEAGGQGLWPEASVAALEHGCLRVMQALDMLASAPSALSRPAVLHEFAWSRSDADGCWYPWVQAGETVRAGQPLGVVTDLLGTTRQQPVSSVEGVVMFAVTSLAINAGDPLVGVGAAA
ncbi:MAG: succinylglutamate desuccinylase/aspartoacylase family protein [Deinococcales bacterium]